MLLVDWRRFKRRYDGTAGEQGFTLIELLVVLLIIGILLTIAIPTFLSVTKSANNTATQSNLQTALTGAKTFYTENDQTYTRVLSGFAGIDTGLSAVSGASTGPHVISFGQTSAGGGSLLGLAAWSSGTRDCWGIVDATSPVNIDGETAFSGTLYTEDPGVSSATCNGTLFLGGSKVGKLSTTGFADVA